MAVAAGQRVVIKLLMERGASSALTDRNGYVPLLCAASNPRASLCLAELVLDLLRRARSPAPSADTIGCLEALERFLNLPQTMDLSAQPLATGSANLPSTGGYSGDGDLDELPITTPKRPAPHPPTTSSPTSSGDADTSFGAPPLLSFSGSSVVSASGSGSCTLQLSREDNSDADAETRFVADGCGAEDDAEEPAPDEDIYSDYMA